MEVGIKSVDIQWSSEGKGRILEKTDAEEQKHGEQPGLDTPLVHALTDECSRLFKKNYRRS